MPNIGDIIRAEDFKTNGGFIGQIIEFPSNLIPSNTLLCDGSEISRETYSELFNVIGTIYGEGDGSTTFNIPDYRGAFLRCIGGNADSIGVLQGDAIRNITGLFRSRAVNERDQLLWRASACFVQTLSSETARNIGYVDNNLSAAMYEMSFDASRVVPTADENRPINYAVNVCVVYE